MGTIEPGLATLDGHMPEAGHPCKVPERHHIPIGGVYGQGAAFILAAAAHFDGPLSLVVGVVMDQKGIGGTARLEKHAGRHIAVLPLFVTFLDRPKILSPLERVERGLTTRC